MTKLNLTVILLFISIMTVKSQNSVIQLNSLGYLPKKPKIASITTEFQTFQIINSETNEVVLKGKAKGPVQQNNFENKVWNADFSKLKATGTFQLIIDSGQNSSIFTIANNVYNDAFTTSMRAFYLWRCGSSVSGDYHGVRYEHEACHMEDGYLDYIGEEGKQKDGTGGWHDAGDHGKYVVNAGVTVGQLFFAWDHFNEKLKKINLDLPETASGFPQFLKEVKWETDWLLKMQYTDGSGKVSHKLTRKNFSGFIMPEDDHEKRYFTEWSSAATADFVAMMAQAARYFKPYDAEYAQQCLDAAKTSYQFLVENPESKRFEQNGFQTGGYQSGDSDDRLWAVAELWETTGDDKFLLDFETRISAMKVKVDEIWDWGNIKNMGVYTYLLSKRKGKNPDIYKSLKKEAIAVADEIVAKAKLDEFGRPLGNKYYWGCNGTVARQVLNLQVANMLKSNKKYKETALDAIHHIFGRNIYARSYVTGLGDNPPMHPHCRRSGADGIVAPWPGYIVGGGQTSTNWVDEEASFSTNEIAINWQAALVYALAGFVE